MEQKIKRTEADPKKNDTCTCIYDIQDRIMNHHRDRHKDRVYEDANVFGDFGFQNLSLSLSGGVNLYFPFKAQYTFTKVNGEQSKPRSEIISIYPTYCPFCGRKIRENNN